MDTLNEVIDLLDKQNDLIGFLLKRAWDDLDTIGELSERVTALDERLRRHQENCVLRAVESA